MMALCPDQDQLASCSRPAPVPADGTSPAGGDRRCGEPPRRRGRASRVPRPGSAGKRRPDPPQVCIQTVRTARPPSWPSDSVSRPAGWPSAVVPWVAGCAPWPWPRAWRSAALVLISYPLHPPGRPDRLRTAHFPDLHVPCLFVSGRRDAFGTPAELERETAAIPGPSRSSSSMGTIHCGSGTPRSRASSAPGWPG